MILVLSVSLVVHHFQTAPATFRQLFERLRRLNVPPAKLDALMREMDIRLVFTAHPTEIVRHTVRHKQRKVATLLQHLQSNSAISDSEREIFRLQLEEEIRLWWRTDELHQFKPLFLMRLTMRFIIFSRFCLMQCLN